MKTETSVSSQQANQQDTPSSGTYHSSIKTLLYDAFISVITDESLKPLVISGNPPVDELVSAWENICNEYQEAIKTEQSKSVFDCYKKIVRTKATIQIIDSALFYLYYEFDQEIATMLGEMGYAEISFNEDREQYLKKIEFVRTQAKTLVILLNQYKNEYKMLSPDEKADKMEYADYIGELAILSKYQGYAIRAKEITVLEYIGIVNSFIAYNEVLKKTER